MVARIADLNGLKIDCSAFTPVKNVAEMKLAAPTPGLRSEFLFADEDGHTYEGPTPYMVQRNALGFLQRENGIAQARKSAADSSPAKRLGGAGVEQRYSTRRAVMGSERRARRAGR